MIPRRGLVLALIGAAACRGPAADTAARTRGRAEVEAVLDALHGAASRADEQAYFALFAPDAVFLGTDPDERWSVEAFRAYAHPHFCAGRGWTYRSIERHVGLSPGLEMAWFDERLQNENYGECRGTGVLRRDEGRWRVVQYSLSLPVPNELASDLVERIRSRPGEG